MGALEDTAEEGDVGEDDSQEYALTYDPTLREKQLAMPEYAWPTNKSSMRALQVFRKSEYRRAAAKSSDMRKNRKLRSGLLFMRAVTRMHKFAITP